MAGIKEQIIKLQYDIAIQERNISRMNEQVSQRELEIESYEREIETLLGETQLLESQLERIQEDIKAENIKLDDYQARRSQYAHECVQCQNNIYENTLKLKQLARDIPNLEQQMSKLDGRIYTIESTFDSDFNAKESKLKPLYERRDELRRRWQILSNKKSEAQFQLEHNQSLLEQNKKNLEISESQIRSCSRNISRLNSELWKKKSEIEAVRGQIKLKERQRDFLFDVVEGLNLSIKKALERIQDSQRSIETLRMMPASPYPYPEGYQHQSIDPYAGLLGQEGSNVGTTTSGLSSSWRDQALGELRELGNKINSAGNTNRLLREADKNIPGSVEDMERHTEADTEALDNAFNKWFGN